MLARMVRLERLRADHAAAVLAFERENREYFTRFISDRGDAYFAEFAAQHEALLAEQDAGTGRFHVVVDCDGEGESEGKGELLGRVNLTDVQDGGAVLGYRIGERAAGRGVATAAVRELCRLAAGEYGLGVLTAVVALDNPASAAVLGHNGFVAVGNFTVVGRPGLRYRRELGAGIPAAR